MVARKRRNTTAVKSGSNSKHFWHSAPIVLFVLGAALSLFSGIQLVATMRNYVMSVTELHALQNEETSLMQQKRLLDRNIERWKDKAYITAQARERLGFVFPGEQAVRVEHPEAVTGFQPKDNEHNGMQLRGRTVLPWYADLSYALQKADKPDTLKTLMQQTKTMHHAPDAQH